MTARASSSNFECSCNSKLFQSWWSWQLRRLRCSADLAARGAAPFVLMKFNQWRQRLNFTVPSCMSAHTHAVGFARLTIKRHLVHVKVARTKSIAHPLLFFVFGAKIFTEDVECYPEQISNSENGVICMSKEICAVLTIYGHFFVVLKNNVSQVTSKYPHFEVAEKASLTKKNIPWKLRRTLSGSVWDTD